MNLLPIEADDSLNERFRGIPECEEVLNVFVEFYKKVGFNKPWIAYFVTDSKNEIVGGGGFKGMPKDHSVEISYGTFKSHERRGIGTEICRQLVLLSLQTDPSVKIRARTLPENISSQGVLKRNGFTYLGTVQDEEDGEVLEWEYQGDFNQSINSLTYIQIEYSQFLNFKARCKITVDGCSDAVLGNIIKYT